MARRDKKGVEMDLSSFMAVLIMTIGCLIVILVVNVLIIISNPNNTSVTSVIRSALYEEDEEEGEGQQPFPLGNVQKEPAYIDVRRDRLIIYPGEHVLSVRDLQQQGNAFERLLETTTEKKDTDYIVLLIRPHSAVVARQLKKTIRQREIDLGFELYEEGRPIDYEAARAASHGEEEGTDGP